MSHDFLPAGLRTRQALHGIALLICASACSVHAHGDLDVRIGQLNRQLTADPENTAFLLQRADLRREHGHLSDALVDAQKARQLCPDWAAVQLQAARIQFDLDLISDAQSSAETALRLEPDNADARVIHARCLVRFARTKEAVADLTHVLSGKAAATPDLYLERARLQAESGDCAGAVRGLDEGVSKLGKTPSLVLPAIEYERRRGAFSEALARLESASQFLPPESALVLRGEILIEAGRAQEARTVFQTALFTLTNHPQHFHQNSEAEEALRKRLSQDLHRLEENLLHQKKLDDAR